MQVTYSCWRVYKTLSGIYFTEAYQKRLYLLNLRILANENSQSQAEKHHVPCLCQQPRPEVGTV
jgi:hypothetical protein